ncbi:MAG: UDP-N-acetylmuramoyl-L-alanyl-D-glutamate--2,6-diaminopimelate ligase [Sulfurospirillum sp.]|nr:UDP-N-acetylmuramoyl-L-alanyl-D-glutamate--2,6-diaminopimelate ligase [Sulfurospirillum sp.]
MRLQFSLHNEQLFICDNTQECDMQTYLLRTSQNDLYLKDFDAKKCKGILSIATCKQLLGIDERIKIIGITGTNGKTTTAAAIYSILLDLGKKVGLQGTRGSFINDVKVSDKSLTTPPILQTLHNLHVASQQCCEYFVMEVSSHAIVQKRVEGLSFALKILTNISQDHLDYHKTFENYVAIKSSFFDDTSLKLINKDEPKIQFNPKNCMTYGLEKPATYKVAAYSLKDGISVAIQNIDKMFHFHSSMHGLFNVYNLTAALSGVDMLKVAPQNEICEAIENFAGVSGRMEVVSEEPLVIVDFAHTPDGIEKVLDALKEKEIIVVFGAGGDRDRSKRPLMGKIAKRFSKYCIITSDNPRSEDPLAIIADIQKGISNNDGLHVQPDRKKAIALALQLCTNEVVVILGKGDETTQEIQGMKFAFDDREIVQELLKKDL